jgi:hypothetical protein
MELTRMTFNRYRRRRGRKRKACLLSRPAWLRLVSRVQHTMKLFWASSPVKFVMRILYVPNSATTTILLVWLRAWLSGFLPSAHCLVQFFLRTHVTERRLQSQAVETGQHLSLASRSGQCRRMREHGIHPDTAYTLITEWAWLPMSTLY